MNFNLYVDDATAEALRLVAERAGATRNAIVREAIAAYITRQGASWPSIVAEHRGAPQAPRFESLRDELVPPADDPFLSPAPRRRRSKNRKP